MTPREQFEAIAMKKYSVSKSTNGYYLEEHVEWMWHGFCMAKGIHPNAC